MPRCYMVKKGRNKYMVTAQRDSWSSSCSSDGEAASPSSGEAAAAASAAASAVEVAPGPVSPAAPSSPPPPPYYSPLDAVTPATQHSYLHEFIPQCQEEPSVTCHEEVLDHDGGIPIFRLRSAEETEAAHDLLELARSLPPLPAPGVATARSPSAAYRSPTHIQEIHSRYTPEASPSYDVAPSSSYPSPVVYLPQPQSPSSEGIICFHQTPAPGHPPCYNPKTTSSKSPLSLTPPTSEYSSDAENNNPNPQRESELRSQEIEGNPKISVVYTYDALLVTDGRSKNKNGKKVPPPPSSPAASERGEDESTLEEPPEAPGNKAGRYVCSECGKQYATSSNLSRHKQTHRSLDSQSAKKCLTCGKAYVSMPALAMHLLTHKLSHACGVCGKLFSRPWLLQGHLRSHSGEKPFGCAHCGKAFADRSNLRAHMQTHSADKNYACARCHKSFALKSYLNKHLESACFKDGGCSGVPEGGERAASCPPPAVASFHETRPITPYN